MGQESQLRRLAGLRKSKSSPPVLSQEFFIQNHGDIFSCVLMLVFVGFVLPPTASLSQMLVWPQYNTTSSATPEDTTTTTRYGYGLKDVFTSLFYVCGWITVHAILQEYVIDKLQRKLHLSKTKTSKFTESGHLAAFALYSAIHAGYVMHKEQWFPEINQLWTGYPEVHREMTFLVKIFFLIQISYWLHQFPEFWLQKCKRDEIKSRSVYTIFYLAFITGGYLLNFNRVTMAILMLHYSAEFLFHICRMAHFAEKTAIASPGFKLWNIYFVLVRLGCVTLAAVTFWYGLRLNEAPYVDIAQGNFNTPFIRLDCLLVVGAVQAWMMWNFITFHLRRMRERSASGQMGKGGAGNRYPLRNKQRKSEKKQRGEDDVRDLPEVDQETNRVLQSAKKAKAL